MTAVIVAVPLLISWGFTTWLLVREIELAERIGYHLGRSDELLGAPDMYETERA